MATDRGGVTPDGLLDGRRPTDAMDFQATEDSASEPPCPCRLTALLAPSQAFARPQVSL